MLYKLGGRCRRKVVSAVHHALQRAAPLSSRVLTPLSVRRVRALPCRPSLGAQASGNASLRCNGFTRRQVGSKLGPPFLAVRLSRSMHLRTAVCALWARRKTEDELAKATNAYRRFGQAAEKGLPPLTNDTRMVLKARPAHTYTHTPCIHTATREHARRDVCVCVRVCVCILYVANRYSFVRVTRSYVTR